MKNIIILVLSSMMIILSGCDESPTNEGPRVNYDLVIDNQTDTNYQVYLAALVEGESGFTKIGEVTSYSQYRKSNLIIDISYECRLVLVGGTVDDPALTKSFTHTMLTDYIWSLK